MLKAQHARRVLLEKLHIRLQAFTFAVTALKHKMFKKIHAAFPDLIQIFFPR